MFHRSSDKRRAFNIPQDEFEILINIITKTGNENRQSIYLTNENQGHVLKHVAIKRNKTNLKRNEEKKNIKVRFHSCRLLALTFRLPL